MISITTEAGLFTQNTSSAGCKSNGCNITMEPTGYREQHQVKNDLLHGKFISE
jgi:hypothetical protein